MLSPVVTMMAWFVVPFLRDTQLMEESFTRDGLIPCSLRCLMTAVHGVSFALEKGEVVKEGLPQASSAFQHVLVFRCLVEKLRPVHYMFV